MPDGLDEMLNVRLDFTPPQDPYAQRLERRVADLEDCLEELAPFAKCSEVDMVAHFSAETEEEAVFKGNSFKRDTLYVDQRIFRKVAKLLAQRIGRGA